MLFVLLVVLLVTPLRLEVDTRKERYGMSMGWVGSFSVVPGEWPWRYRARILFVSWERPLEVDAGRITGSVEEPAAHRKERAGRKRRPLTDARRRWLLRALWRVLKAGKVRRFRWRLSTHDPVLDAWLYPWMHLWRVRGADVGVRFDGRNELALVLEHSAARALWAVMRTR